MASTQDWQVTVQDGAASVQVQHLSALNAAERATLFADLPAPQGEERPLPGRTAPCAARGCASRWPPPGPMAPVRLHIHHTAQTP